MIINQLNVNGSSPTPTPSGSSGGLQATAIYFMDRQSGSDIFAVLYPEYCTTDTLCFRTANDEYYYTDILDTENSEMAHVYDTWYKGSGGGQPVGDAMNVWWGGVINGNEEVLFVTSVDLQSGQTYYSDRFEAGQNAFYTIGTEMSVGLDIYDAGGMQIDNVVSVIDSTLKTPVAISYNNDLYFYSSTLQDSIQWENGNGVSIYTAGTKLLGNSVVDLYDGSHQPIGGGEILLWLAQWNGYYCRPNGSNGATTASFGVYDGMSTTIWVDITSNSLVGANVYSDSMATTQIGQITNLLN